ncbi:MAG: threonylcarbamoyl-AMP synthase [Ignavibacteria bacterium]|nr:threonylcarbamoyl-AMP synthase [Ignavibacteria bacterium]
MQTKIINSAKVASQHIKKGNIVAFPTETVYGLGANAYDEKAVKKIFKAKGRPADNPLIVHVAYKRDINFLVKEITPSAKKIIKEFFPGPATVILRKNEIVPDVVTGGLDTIAIRMPASKIAREFIKACGVPIAAPSANLSGSPSPTSFVHALKDMKGKIPCILTGPDAKYGLESTVIDCTGKHPVILRPGSITLEHLKKLDKQTKYGRSTGKIKSPGQKYRHYSPKANVRLISDFGSKIANSKNKKAFIGLSKKLAMGYELVKICRTPEEYAMNLFSFFHKCDEMGIKTIYCEKISEKGVGAAIMNRLNKASIK